MRQAFLFPSVLLCVACSSVADSPASSIAPGASETRQSSEVSKSLQKVDRRPLALMAARHNQAMRELVSLAASGQMKKWSPGENCSAIRQLASKYDQDNRASGYLVERNSPRLSVKLNQVLPPKLHFILDDTYRASCSFEYGVLETTPFGILAVQEAPLIPLTAAATDLLYSIPELALDEPVPATYSSRLNSIRTSALGLDSLEQILVFAASEVADSSYALWYTELPVMAAFMADGTESGECTITGLEDGARHEVLEDDFKGAVTGALTALLIPSSWSLGWISAVPAAVGYAATGAIVGSGGGAATQVAFHRRPRCH